MSLTIVIALCLTQEPLPALSLSDAYQQAQVKNLDLKVAHARLEQARLLHDKVWAHQLPRVDAAGIYAHNSQEIATELPTGYSLRTVGTTSLNGPAYDPSKPISTKNPPGTPSNTIIVPSGYETTYFLKKDQLAGGLTVTVPLIVPELWPKFHEAELGARLATDAVEQARRDVLFGVAQIYYGAASLREAIGVQQRLLDNALGHERDAQTRVQAGALPRIGLVRAQLDRTRAEQDLLRAKNAYAGAKSALAALLDRAPDFEVMRPEDPVVPESLVDPEATALTSRVDLKVARQQHELAEETATGVLYKYAPTVAATGALLASNTKAFAPDYEMWSVAVAFKWTLWDGGLREIERKEQQLKIAETSAALDSATAKAKDEVRRATLDLTSARQPGQG